MLPTNAQRAQRREVGPAPALQNRVRRMRRPRKRDAPGGDAEEGAHVAVSRIRQHSSSNDTPSAAADLGISEWLVMPGAVLASSSQLRPSRSRMKSTRAQPRRLSRSEEHTSELQSLMRISYAVFCLKKKTKTDTH